MLAAFLALLRTIFWNIPETAGNQAAQYLRRIIRWMLAAIAIYAVILTIGVYINNSFAIMCAALIAGAGTVVSLDRILARLIQAEIYARMMRQSLVKPLLRILNGIMLGLWAIALFCAVVPFEGHMDRLPKLVLAGVTLAFAQMVWPQEGKIARKLITGLAVATILAIIFVTFMPQTTAAARIDERVAKTIAEKKPTFNKKVCRILPGPVNTWVKIPYDSESDISSDDTAGYVIFRDPATGEFGNPEYAFGPDVNLNIGVVPPENPQEPDDHKKYRKFKVVSSQTVTVYVPRNYKPFSGICSF